MESNPILSVVIMPMVLHVLFISLFHLQMFSSINFTKALLETQLVILPSNVYKLWITFTLKKCRVELRLDTNSNICIILFNYFLLHDHTVHLLSSYT